MIFVNVQSDFTQKGLDQRIPDKIAIKQKWSAFWFFSSFLKFMTKMNAKWKFIYDCNHKAEKKYTPKGIISPMERVRLGSFFKSEAQASKLLEDYAGK